MQDISGLFLSDDCLIEKTIELARTRNDVYAGLRIEDGGQIPEPNDPVRADRSVYESMRHIGNKIYIAILDSFEACPVTACCDCLITLLRICENILSPGLV